MDERLYQDRPRGAAGPADFLEKIDVAAHAARAAAHVLDTDAISEAAPVEERASPLPNSEPAAVEHGNRRAAADRRNGGKVAAIDE